MKTIRWGILGCGNVTEVKSGPGFQKAEGAELHAVMRRNAHKAKDYATRHRVPKWYDNAEDLINDSKVDAIYVATPPNAHAELAIKALKAGKPVYVEKPMARNYTECLQMLDAAEKYNTPLFVAYYRRALPGFRKVKELIDSGIIGGARLVNMQLFKSLAPEEISGDLPWRVQPEIAGGGHLFDLAAHQLDFMDYLFGPITEVKSLAKNQAGKYPAEDIVAASFWNEQNIMINGQWCFTIPDFLQKDTIEIIGTKGKIVLSCFDFVPVELHTGKGIERFDYPKPEHVQQYLIQEITNELLGKGVSPSTGKTGARTSRVLDEMVAKYYQK